MKNFKKQIIEEERKEQHARKVAIIAFWLLMPFIAYVGVQIWSGILGF